jgi:hypothetical protein
MTRGPSPGWRRGLLTQAEQPVRRLDREGGLVDRHPALNPLRVSFNAMRQVTL